MIRRLAIQFGLISIALAMSVSATSTAWADGDVEPKRKPLPEVSAKPAAPTPACENAGQLAGTVSSVSGAAFAQAPGEQPRSLACDSVVNACDRVFTADGGRIALLIDDVYFQLGSGSSVQIESAGAAFFVNEGAARVIDTRDANAAHFGLASPQFRSRGLHADAEVHVDPQTSVKRTRFCSFGDAITVSAPEALSVGDGACVEFLDESYTQLARRTPTIGLVDALECRRDFALSEGWLPPVGPPAATGFLAVGASGLFVRQACDNPGSGCAGGPPPAIRFKDPNPNTGCGFPGAGCP